MKKEVLPTEEFFRNVIGELQKRDVLSVGEHHDDRQDTSFSWILDYEREILNAYSIYGVFKNSPKPAPALEKLLERDSDLLDRMSKETPSIDQLKKMHVGRLFAQTILPLAALAGYNHVVFEGIDENGPSRLLDRSKDKIGDLLRLTMAMRLGLKIHGAYSGEGLFSTAADVGDALFEKIEEVKRNDPDARIIVYNGAVHNMTEPFKKGMKIREGLVEYEASDLTYAPRAREKWGAKYGAIDLLNGDRLLPDSHFKVMQQEASPTEITAFSHGIDQKSFVIK